MEFSDVLIYSKGLSVLFIEDDDAFREETFDIFNQLFNLVDTATGGIDGLEKFIEYKKKNQEYYDLVITDINMPQKNGCELIEDILEENFMQPIVVISAHNSISRLQQLISLGIRDFILKTTMSDTLYKVIYNVSKTIQMEKDRLKFEIEKSKLEQEKIVFNEKTTVVNDLIDNISHQWRQPLSLISINSSTLLMKYDNELEIDNEKELVQNIINACESLSQTIEQFRFSEQVLENKKTLFTEDIFAKIKSSIQNDLDNFGIQLQCEIKDGKILSYEKEIIKVLHSIINNSIEAVQNIKQDSRFIFIKSYIQNNILYIQIKDNGGGIEQSMINRVFEPYFTTKFKNQGVGLGLYLCKKTIENQFSGKIKVENSSYEYRDQLYCGLVNKIEIPLISGVSLV